MRGRSQRPAITWLEVPTGTVELAIIVRRGDDQSILWAVTGIDPALPGLDAGPVPAPAREHVRADGEAAWVGPCADDDTVRTYEWELFALASPSGLTAEATAQEAADASGHPFDHPRRDHRLLPLTRVHRRSVMRPGPWSSTRPRCGADEKEGCG